MTISEIKEYYEQIKINWRQIKLYSEVLMPRAEANLKSTVFDFRSGKGDFLMVLESQRMLLKLKKEYYKSVEKYVENYRKLLSCCAVVFLEDKI